MIDSCSCVSAEQAERWGEGMWEGALSWGRQRWWRRASASARAAALCQSQVLCLHPNDRPSPAFHCANAAAGRMLFSLHVKAAEMGSPEAALQARAGAGAARQLVPMEEPCVRPAKLQLMPMSAPRTARPSTTTAQVAHCLAAGLMVPADERLSLKCLGRFQCLLPLVFLRRAAARHAALQSLCFGEVLSSRADPVLH